MKSRQIPATRSLWLPFVVCLLCLATASVAAAAERPLKKGILLVAFGTSSVEGAKAYDGFRALVEAAFPDAPVRLAYTSAHARSVARAKGEALSSPAQALADMAAEGFTHVAVQSLHVIPGFEFHDLVATARALEGLHKGLSRVSLGQPLLGGPEDLGKAAAALIADQAKARRKGEALIFVGHGTEHAAAMAYPALQYHLWRLDKGAFVGVIDGGPSLEDVLAELKARRIGKARLVPLLAVAGEHVRNDIAGTGKDSWVSRLRLDGVACAPVEFTGLAERPEVAALWIEHVKSAWEALGQ